MNDPADIIADRAANDWNETQRLRHELNLSRNELAAAVELHERAGTMIATALGRHALTHQIGWLYEDYAADIRHLVEQGDRLAVTKEWANAKAQIASSLLEKRDRLRSDLA